MCPVFNNGNSLVIVVIQLLKVVSIFEKGGIQIKLLPVVLYAKATIATSVSVFSGLEFTTL